MSLPGRNILFLLLLFANLSYIPHVHALLSQDKEGVIDKKKQDISKIKKQIEEKEKIIKSLQSKEVSILSVIEGINGKINSNRNVLRQTQNKKEKIRKEIKTITSEANRIRAQINKGKGDIRDQLRNSYMMGRHGFLELLLSSGSYAEFEKKRYYLGRLMESENRLLEDFAKRERRLNEKTEALKERNAKLEDLSSRINKTLGSISRDRREKVSVLRAVKSKKELQIKRAKELSRAAQNLQDMIMRMKREYGSGGIDFVASKGDLPKPAPGKIASRFGKHFDKSLGVSISSKGITIQSQPGSKVSPVYAGKVIYSGYFRGYGQIVIVDHGGNYYSLYANMSSLNVKAGTKVSHKDKIGEVGEPSGTRQGLYFEIRHNGIPLNPAPWLR